MSYCETQSLAIGYGAPLLRNISLQAECGRILAFIGPQRRGQIHLIKNAGRAAGGPERRGIAGRQNADHLHPQRTRPQAGTDAAPHGPHRADHLL